MHGLKSKDVEDLAIKLYIAEGRDQSWRALPDFDKQKYRKEAHRQLERAN